MADVTWTVPNKNGSYDGDMVVKQFSSLTINAGDTVTVDQPCRGLLILVQGDVVINGTLTMRTRGPAANPNNSGGSDNSATNSLGLLIPYIKSGGASLSSVAAALNGCGNDAVGLHSFFPSSGTGHVLRIPKAGGNGGAGGGSGSLSVGFSGNSGTNGSLSTSSEYKILTLPGGGAGGKYSDSNSCSSSTAGDSGDGGNATCWTGGTSGGGKMSGTAPSNSAATSGDDYGGAGGNGGNGHCGGDHTTGAGLGNPNGFAMFDNNTNSTERRERPAWGTQSSNTIGGMGGLIVIIAGGNVTIGSGGNITSTGSNNEGDVVLPSGNTMRQGQLYGSGGATGGGAIAILHRGTYTNNGNVNADGGRIGSVDGGTGGNGGDGYVLTEQIA